MVRACHSPVISPPARAVTVPSGRPIVPISHIPAADGSAKSDVARSDSARLVTAGEIMRLVHAWAASKDKFAYMSYRHHKRIAPNFASLG